MVLFKKFVSNKKFRYNILCEEEGIFTEVKYQKQATTGCQSKSNAKGTRAPLNISQRIAWEWKKVRVQ